MVNVDILMKIEDSSGPIKAGGQSSLSKSDTFTADFKPGMFFDVEEFEFDVSLDDQDDSGEGGSIEKPSYKGEKPAKKQKKGRFSRWLGGMRSLKTDGYPVDMQPFEFTRQFDSASPILFQFCANSMPLKSAALVQRKAGGMQTTTGINAFFLRIDFYDVLLTKVSWDMADAVVKEKVAFVCRKILVQYRMQDTDGTFLAPVHGEWKFVARTTG